MVALLLEVVPACQERADVPDLQAAGRQSLLDDRLPCPAAGAEFRSLCQELGFDPGQAGQFGRDQVLGLAEGLDHGHLFGLADLDGAVQLEGVGLAGQLVGQRLGQLVAAEQADVDPAVAGAVAARAADDDREREQNVVSAAVVHDVGHSGLDDGQLQVLVLLVGELAVELVLEYDLFHGIAFPSGLSACRFGWGLCFPLLALQLYTPARGLSTPIFFISQFVNICPPACLPAGGWVPGFRRRQAPPGRRGG